MLGMSFLIEKETELGQLSLVDQIHGDINDMIANEAASEK